jgi:uncharacterized protein (DUF488 family)
MASAIWTLGHSTRDWDAFVSLLAESSIERLADVRRFPGSRRHPQFNREALADGLSRAGMTYRHFAALGGRRSERLAGSPNTAWRVEAFNAFADHMASPEFIEALDELAAWAAPARAALMCSEALPWRCHRRLIADALIVRGWTVWDIIGPGKVEPHALTDLARVRDGRLTYPAAPLFADGAADSHNAAESQPEP